MDPAFDSAAFAMPLKTVSQPVLSQFGFHIIEITSRKGEQGEGPPHPHPHRGRRGASGPSRRPGRFAGAPRRRAGRSGRAGHGSEGALAPHRANRRRCRKAPEVQVGNLVVPDAGVWAFGGPSRAHTSPVIETSFAFYIFRIDSVQAAGVPPLAQVRPAVEFALRNDKKKQLVKPKARGVPQAARQRRIHGRGGQGDEPAEPGIRPVQPGEPAAHRPHGGGHRVRTGRRVSAAACWTRPTGCT